MSVYVSFNSGGCVIVKVEQLCFCMMLGLVSYVEATVIYK